MNGAEKCPGCGGGMQAIRLLDTGHARGHVDMEYAAVDARQNFWSGRYPVAGKVQAQMCPGCGRIALYGAPPTEG